MRDLNEAPLIIAGVGELRGALFLVVEIAAGGYIQDQIITKYEDAGAAIEKIREAAKIHGNGKTLELWTDSTEILLLTLQLVGINARAKHSNDVQPIVTRYLTQHEEILAEFYELDDEEQLKELNAIRSAAIKLLSKLRRSIERLITKLETGGC